jgi:conjugal transfer pilus assembly protein TraB
MTEPGFVLPTRFSIPGYTTLSPKNKQRAHMVLGGLAVAGVVALVSGMIGGNEIHSVAPPDLPKPRSLAAVPGGQLDPKDAWMGGAGKDLATLKAQLTEQGQAQAQLRSEITQTRELLRAELRSLAERGVAPNAPAPPQPTGTMASPPLPVPTPIPAGAGTPPMPGMPGTTAVPANAPAAFPGAARTGIGPGRPGQGGMPAGTYPPGVVPGSGQPMQASQMPAAGAGYVPVLIKASTVGFAPSDGSGPGATAAPGATVPPLSGAAQGRGGAGRNVANFLPVGFTRAVLLGGLAAPTGGQAQANPVPVLLRLLDLAVLPNGWRGQVKDCLVVGEGYGENSAERAYIRTTLLSCVMRDGQVLEVPIKGQVFGEDGMNGMMGKVVTKQGAILANALLSGIAAGIGSGISQASQVVSSTTLGPVNSAPTDANGILKQGFGTGVGKALDRLAQYYINLAERTFPVIEVQPGRVVDVVITQGVSVDVALAAASGRASTDSKPSRGGGADTDRSSLMRLAHGEDDE